MSDSAYDHHFAELARELHFASVEDIGAGRGLQEDLARSGRKISLGEALVQLGAISIAQNEAVDRRVRLQHAPAPASGGQGAASNRKTASPRSTPRHRAAPRRRIPGPAAYAILSTALAVALVLVFLFGYRTRSRRSGPAVAESEVARNETPPVDPAPPAPPVPAPPAAPAPPTDLKTIREGTARRMLDDLKRLEQNNRLSAEQLRSRYAGFVESYRDTAAGVEASERMKSLPERSSAVPPSPAAPPAEPPAVRVPPPDGLVGHWKLERNPARRAKDASGQGHTGKLRGNPQWTKGRVGGGLAFDGKGDFVNTGYKTDLSQWTVACWVRSPRAPASRLPNGPVHREKNFQITWDHRSAKARGSAGVCVGEEWHLASFGPLKADRWYHLAATYDGNALRAYTDGALVTENTKPSGPPDAETFTLKIGAHAFGTSCFRGKVDDVRLYNYALSADDIRKLAVGN